MTNVNITTAKSTVTVDESGDIAVVTIKTAGVNGAGLAPGGTTGQLLVKDSAATYDTSWTSKPSVSGVVFDPELSGSFTDIGQAGWSDDAEGIAVKRDTAVLEVIGQDTHVYVKCAEPGGMTKGQVVMFSGVDTTTLRLKVSLMVADGTYPSYVFFGILAEDITENGFGFVCTKGYIRGIDTSAYPAESVLWASNANPGELVLEQNLLSAPNLRVPTAVCVKSDATNGEIFVRATASSADSTTTVTSANTANTIVLRDGSGNFAAGTVTASLAGNADTATTAVTSATAGALSSTRTFEVTGDVTGAISSDLTSGATIATSIAPGVIVDADINTSASIADTKLGTISTAGKVSNSATTATDANTAGTIVSRDVSGNFAAGTITANLTGNATTATTATSATTAGALSSARTFAITGDVTGTVSSDLTSGASIATSITAGAIVDADINATAAIDDTKLATINTAGKVANSATTAIDTNTANAIVARDASGNFTAGTITANLSGNASTATSATSATTATTAGALSSARTFEVTGDVTGTVSSDLTSGASIATSIAAGAIVNADVNAAAAIAGTKVSPDFGNQNVTTTGTITGASLTPTSSTVPANGIYLPAANEVAIATNSTSALYIDSTGNVGIGETDPDHLLVLKSTGDARLHIQADSDNTGESDNPRISFSQDGSDEFWKFQIGLEGTNGQEFSGSLSNCPIFSASLGNVNQPFIFGHNGQAVMAIKNSSLTVSEPRVGIGTMTPSSSFHVTGGTNSIVIERTDATSSALLCVAASNQTEIYSRASDSSTTARDLVIYSGNTESLRVDTSGNATFTGAVSKGSGSFRIDHPLKSETHQLVHSFIEGPQADNIYRGKANLIGGTATVNIDVSTGMTEGTFSALNREVQCFMTNETGWAVVKGSVTGNILTIAAQDTNCTDTISWLVIGERQDQHMYNTDWTDENGKVIIEPEKVAK